MKKRGKRDWWSGTFVIAVAALIMSGVALWRGEFYSSLDVFVGRQARLYVQVDGQRPKRAKPLVLMNLLFVNDGGKTYALLDTKLTVRWMTKGRIILERDFGTLREVDDLLAAEDDFQAGLISAVAVLGRSSESRNYAYVPLEYIEQDSIPPIFDLEVEVHVRQSNDWESVSRYSTYGVKDVWQDLDDTTYNYKIVNFRPR